MYQTAIIIIFISGMFSILTHAQMRSKKIRRNNFLIFNFVFLLLFICVPLLVEASGGAHTIRWGGTSHKINDPINILTYSVYIFGFTLVSLIFASASKKKPLSLRLQPRSEITSSTYYSYALIWLMVSFFGVLVFIRGTGLGLTELLIAARFSWTNDLGSDGNMVLLGQYMMSMIAPATFCIFSAKKKKALLAFLVLVIVFAMVAVTGGRKWILFALSGYIAGTFISQNEIKVNIRGATLISTALVFVIFWQIGRKLPEVSMPVLIDAIQNNAYQLLMFGDISYFYRASLEAISLNLEEGILYPLAVLRRLVLLPIPNELTFGIKPDSIPHSFALDIGAVTSARVGNMPPGLVGVFALSFGSAMGALILSTVLPALIWKSDSMLKRQTLFTGGLSAYVFAVSVTIARGNVDVLMYVIFYCAMFAFTIFTSAFIRALAPQK